MVEKIGTIKNPLTIIAIFAGIAEISGTAILPFISDGNQATYIWFLMIFPLLLVILFFVTLNFNHKVLYAPSDFKDEENFFKSLKPASPVEREEKLRDQAREVAEETKESAMPEAAVSQTEASAINPLTGSVARSHSSIQARYYLAEELALNKIAREAGKPVHRDISFGGSATSRGTVFDGVIVDKKKVIAIEVKYIQSLVNLQKRVKDVIRRLETISESRPELSDASFSLVLVLVTDLPEEQHAAIAAKAYAIMGLTPFSVEVRVFSFSRLEKDVGN